MNITKKIALVTGAGSGIGRAAALALGRSGWTIILTGRTPETLQETASQIKSSSAVVIPSDVTDPTSVKALFKKIHATFGQLDLLFNNAGINTKATPIEDLSFDQWEAVVNTNLNGSFLCLQEAFTMMKSNNPPGGRIINNGSLSAHTPRPFSIAYNATKHAITGLTKSAALEGRQYNICCGQIDIGNASSNMTKSMAQGTIQADGSIKQEATIDVAHVGNSIAYLADLPLDVNIPSFTIMANKMPYIGRG